MGAVPSIDTLISKIKAVRQGIEPHNQKAVALIARLEHSINEILVGMRRPVSDGFSGTIATLSASRRFGWCRTGTRGKCRNRRPRGGIHAHQ